MVPGQEIKTMTNLYTLAIGADMLLATVPCGQNIVAAVAREWAMIASEDDEIPEFEVIHGCVLTNDATEGDDCIVWKSGNSGWIIDENGTTWRHAVRNSQHVAA